MRRRIASFLLLTLAVVAVGGAPAISSATPASGPLALTLYAPTAAEANTAITFSGSVKLATLGMASQSVEILSNGSPVATATSDMAGNYQAQATLPSGAHTLVAVAHRGIPQLESRSATTAITVRSRFNVLVVLAGTGTGSVTSSTGGIECPSDCTESFLSDAPITLTAAAAAGSSFTGWSGACSGTGLCTPSGAGSTLTVTATFADVTAPVAPRITGLAPGSPANNNNPFVSGVAEAGSTVTIYGAAACTGAVKATATAANFAGGVSTVVADNTTTSFSAKATDAAGNVSPCSMPVVYVEDSAAPDTTIASAPAALVNVSSATFTFTATETASFECALDGGAFTACTSPASYSNLADGAHTFRVRSTDAAQNQDASPAAATWIVDTLPPSTAITAAPASPTNATAASFTFDAESGASYACSLDGAAYAACTSPKSYAALADGSHTFRVRATDTAGNTGPVSEHSWTVDTAAPTATISSGPPAETNQTTATIHFASEPGAALECALDAGAFAACTSPQTLSGLTAGGHTYRVRARDAAGNTSSAASITWTVDLTAPNTTISSSPPSLTSSKSASFALSATEAATFECALDGAAFDACATTASFTGLNDGSHTFQARATDRAGNLDASPASFTWTVDSVAPTTSISSAPPAVTNATSASIAFSASEAATFACSLDDAPFAACTSPRAYSGLTNGRHTVQVRGTDGAGNAGAPATVSWTVDTIEPSVSITAGPPSATNQTTATFEFMSESGATTTCSLDGAAFAACSSPHTTGAVTNGSHTFAVRATDAAGNAATTPARSWTVDTIPPDTSIASGPSGTTATGSATFTFNATEAASFACALDGGASAPCSSPLSYNGLSTGSHTFSVVATDAAGNVDGTAATRTWTVDPVGAQVTITSTPANPTNASSASFSFTAPGGTTTACAIDGSSFVACTSPRSYTGLSDGSHTFQVRATDGGGATGPAAAYAWTIDTLAPVATITSGPAGATNQTSAAFEFETEPGASLECALDAGSFAACTSPQTVSGLGNGSHTYRVRARDAAGNLDPTPDSVSWIVDTVAAAPTIGVTPSGPANNNVPYLAGSAEANSTVRVYALAGCAGSPVVTGPAADYATGLTASVPDDSSTSFSARIVDAAGNTSACSSAVGYVEDSTAPGLPYDLVTVPTAKGQITVSWSAANDAVTSAAGLRYEVCVNETPGRCGASFVVAATTNPGSRIARVNGLSDRKPYELAVRAVDQAGNRGSGATTNESTIGRHTIKTIAAGLYHSCALLGDGTARCWGHNTQGQLGDGTTTNRTTPTAVTGLTGAIGIAAGLYHSCALLGDGTARCWGNNGNGQLGDGTTIDRTTPVAVTGLTGAVGIAAGTYHSCALLGDGTARCWGNNGNGQLGDGTTTNRTTPVTVTGLTGAIDLASGGYHSCALLGDGTARCWGYNFYGQLGDGTTNDRLTPVAVAGLTGAISIATGQYHSCALLGDITARCWGDNVYGQLGDGTTTNRTTPVAVTGLTGAVGIAAGSYHSCALLGDGTARCWGCNVCGQLGDGTTTDRTTPVAVTGLTGAISIAAGTYHSCALLGDGTARCWGYNAYGQLGDGTTTNRTTPVTVTGLPGAVGIATGTYHSCALLGDGTARCWGYNAYGQLGDGTTIDRTTPVAVTGLTGAVGIATGQYHSCALVGDGTTRCWGYNVFGQLGDGTTIDRTTPVAVTGLTGAVGIATGLHHSCAPLGEATARCWGYNAQGQLGDGTTTNRRYPTKTAFIG